LRLYSEAGRGSDRAVSGVLCSLYAASTWAIRGAVVVRGPLPARLRPADMGQVTRIIQTLLTPRFTIFIGLMPYHWRVASWVRFIRRRATHDDATELELMATDTGFRLVFGLSRLL